MSGHGKQLAIRDASRPPLYGDLRSWALVGADSLELLASLPEHSIDALITDPPYGLAFKDEHWDGGELAHPTGFQAFSTTWAREARRVLRPGGYLVCFGATRTFHRLTAGIEDAGLEIRDVLLWLHGAGVPKSLRLPGGLGTALKPAYEPILLARAPLGPRQTVLANVARHGTGALNIDATRLRRPDAVGEGYWPSQLLLEHSPTCDLSPNEDFADGAACAKGCVVRQIDEIGPNGAFGLSRLFYAAKATRAEREAGCESLATTTEPIFNGRKGGVRARANLHPTVKPLDLMRWLVRLAAPPGGVVLDPFAGSGSTGCAVVLEGRQFVGIEREARFLPIARARLTHWANIARANDDPRDRSEIDN